MFLFQTLESRIRRLHPLPCIGRLFPDPIGRGVSLARQRSSLAPKTSTEMSDDPPQLAPRPLRRRRQDQPGPTINTVGDRDIRGGEGLSGICVTSGLPLPVCVRLPSLLALPPFSLSSPLEGKKPRKIRASPLAGFQSRDNPSRHCELMTAPLAGRISKFKLLARLR